MTISATISSCLVLAAALAFGQEEDRIVSRLRIGPFYEQARTSSGSRFWAVRPFYSRLIDETEDTVVTDVLWPLGTGHQLHNRRWWRAGLAYGTNDGIGDESSPWTWNLFPVWYSGKTRQGENYWALFPVLGHVPHTLFTLDEIDFALWPLYFAYDVNHVRRRYYLWPIFSWHDRQPDSKRWGYWPFWGGAQHKGRKEEQLEDGRYCLWPLWTQTRFSGGNDGFAWMLWPLFGSVSREKEQQRLFLPPFFSWAKTGTATRWRFPWPIFETVSSPELSRFSFFPVYGQSFRPQESRHYILWPFIDWFNIDTGALKTHRFHFFPFYTEQSRVVVAKDGSEKPVDDFFRIWPFWSTETRADGKKTTRCLDLLPIRKAGGFERNISPFWTFYTREEKGGIVDHTFLWGLIKIHRDHRPSDLPPPEPPEPEEVLTEVPRAGFAEPPVEPLLLDLSGERE